MCRTVVLTSTILLLVFTYGGPASAQNVAPDPQSNYQPPVPASPYQSATGGSSNGNSPITIQQAKVWQPDVSQIKSPDEIRAVMAQRRQKFETTLNSWVGGDINELIMAWGAPSGVYKMPNQNAVFTWQSTGGVPTPEGGELMIFCKISIFTDPHGRIFNWRWEGNGCA